MGLVINNLSFKYKKNYVLKDINLVFEENKIYGLIGKSGSGKTTLLHLIDDLLKPTSGSIIFNNKKINKRDVGFVFQFPEDEFFNKTVKEELEFSLKNFKMSKKNIKDFLSIFDLDLDILDRNIDELSYAEKRMVAIISSVIYNPKIILFDEPTVGLSYSNKKKVINLIKTLNNKYNKIIIVVSHDIDMLYEISDELVILKDNTVYKNGKTTEIYDDCDTFIPTVVQVEKEAKKRGKMLLKSRCINDLIKEVYRNV